MSTKAVRTNPVDPKVYSNETRGLKASVGKDEFVRIAVFSFGWLTGKKESRWRIVDEALAAAFSGVEGKKLALFPGVQATETGKAAFPDDPKALAALISGHGASGLFESFDGGAPAFYFASDAKAGLLPVKIRQTFATHAVKQADVANLVAACGPKGERTVVVGGVPIGLLICGENNVLANRQADDNNVYIRHELDGELFQALRVVFNGAHSHMGNWGKLERRFEYLSREKRLAFFATNCDKNLWGKGSVRAYYDGALVADSADIYGQKPGKFSRVDPSDNAMALILDVKGMHLA